MTQEQQQVAEFYVLRNDDPRLIAGLAINDEKAMRLLKLVGSFLKAMDTPRPPMCLTCDHRFRRRDSPPVLVMMVRWGCDWLHDECFVVCPVCEQCARCIDDDQLARHLLKMVGGRELQTSDLRQ